MNNESTTSLGPRAFHNRRFALRLAGELPVRRCMTEYEAADRNAEMIEEMAEDIEIARRAACFDVVLFRR